MQRAQALLLALCTLPSAAVAAGPGPVDVGLEYRAQHTTMKPLSVNDLTATNVGLLEHRLRVDLEASLTAKARVIVQADLLDGVIFGDNGSFVGTPRRNRGALIATRSPNLSRPIVGVLDPEAPSLDPDNYGLVLAEAPPLEINHVYGEVVLPVGLLRAGRQPVSRGRTVLVHSGGRINRWGVSRGNDSVDGVLFATKLDAIVDAVRGLSPDASVDRGLFLAVLGGVVAEQQVVTSDDDLKQMATTLFWLMKDERLFGLPLDYLDASLIHSYRGSNRFDTELQSFGAALSMQTDLLRVSLNHTFMLGGTREVSEAFALLGNVAGKPALQEIRAFGGFAEVALRLLPFELSFELFYASGDDDPDVASAFTQLTFAEDTNVGLHLFENVLAYQTERASRLGTENLKVLNPASFPLDAISTRGGLVNAIVLFPQVLAYPWDWLSLRAGAMFAFTHVRSVDPVGTLLHNDGVSMEDDLRNFNGGPPGDYWGTELDLGVTWLPVPGFALDLEGAWLMPGNALEDEHGDAVDSFYAALRMTWWTR